ncbi:MAG: hypothetical protein C0485_06185 [Pirellula sp.]|nr:hypothetical protein [Pirellula sp.]
MKYSFHATSLDGDRRGGLTSVPGRLDVNRRIQPAWGCILLLEPPRSWIDPSNSGATVDRSAGKAEQWACQPTKVAALELCDAQFRSTELG